MLEPREEKIGPISHTDVVNHFKLLIYQKTDIPPSEQRILQGDAVLSQIYKPLGQYGVLVSKEFDLFRGCVQADDDDGVQIIEDPRLSRPERGGGFGKSALVRSSTPKTNNLDKKTSAEVANIEEEPSSELSISAGPLINKRRREDEGERPRKKQKQENSKDDRKIQGR